MFSTISRHKGKCCHALLHKRQWISLEDLRKFFLTHTVISPSYYDSQRSFSLYHCSSWPAQCFLSTLPGFKAAIPALCCAPDACWCCQHLRTSLRFTKHLYLTWNLMQNKIAKCRDPAIFTDYSITEPIFTVHQEYNKLQQRQQGYHWSYWFQGSQGIPEEGSSHPWCCRCSETGCSRHHHCPCWCQAKGLCPYISSGLNF